MQNLRCKSIKIPHFNSKSSDVRQFFRKYNFYKNAYIPPWNNEISLRMFPNFLDDSASLFFESLAPEIRENFELLQEEFIIHYDSGLPISLRWEKLLQRKQGISENVTDYYAALLRLSQNMHLTPEVKLYIFLSGLEKNTKIHLQLFNPPENLAEAFRRAKIFQSVNKTVKSQEPSVFLAKLEKLDNIVEKLNSFTHEAIFQPSISPDLRGK